MDTRVELEVLDNGLSFTLDDAVKGVLDNTTYKLSTAFYDITDWVYSVNIKRGRNREYDRFSAGTMTVELRNHERTFDPTYTAGPFYGELLPQRMMRVWTDEMLQFVGFIEDWDFSYSPGGESTVSISAADGFTKLAQFELQNIVRPSELPGDRTNAILNTYGWSAIDRRIDAGSSVLAAGTATGEALSYLQEVETSELGYMFIGKDGFFNFQERNVSHADYVPLSFSDDGSGVSFDSVDVSYSTDTVTNQAFVVWAGGTAVATGDASQTKYGVISKTLDTQIASSSMALEFAQYFVGQFSEPEYNVDAVSITLDRSSIDAGSLLALEIGDLVSISFTPNGFGDPIVKLAEVLKLEHSIRPDSHRMVVGISGKQFVGFTLDSTIFGILDIDRLAF